MNKSIARVDKPVLRYHGAKFRLADWILQFFPDHKTYVEPFGGSAGILMKKPRSYAEVYNDLDRDIVCLFEVLRNPTLSKELKQQLELTPYARDEFIGSYADSSIPVESARRTIIRAFMGFGSAGATKHSTGFRIDTAREYGTSVDLWAKYPESLEMFCRRLTGVVIENKPAIEVIRNHDRKETLFYLDPPYVHSTRQMGKNRQYYRHEMTDDQHQELIAEILELEGMVIISGYESDLYAEQLEGWRKESTPARISAGSGTGIRTEVLWMNQACSDNQRQGRLI